jgi:putative heme transporter
MIDTPREPSQSVPFAIRVAASWSWRLLLMLAAVLALLALLSTSQVLWVPVVLALLLTLLLKGPVDWMTSRWGLWRGAASLIAVLGLVVIVGGLLAVAGQQIIAGFADLWDQTQAGFAELLVYLSSGPLGLDSVQLDDYVHQIGDQLQANSGTLVTGALSVTTTIGHVAAGTLITVFCLLFFLKDGALIWAWIVRLVPSPSRVSLHESARRGVVTLGAFTRTQILVALIDAVGIGLGALILGLPLVVPLSVLVFLASFVPFVGAIATGAIAVLVALVDQGPVSALIMLAIVLAVQQLEGHVLQPFLLGHAVSVHPVAVLLAVTGGSLSAGIIGALLAVPFVATVNTVALYLHGHDKFPELGDDSANLARRIAELNGDTPEPAADVE